MVIIGGGHHRVEYNDGVPPNVDRINPGCATSRAFREVALTNRKQTGCSPTVSSNSLSQPGANAESFRGLAEALIFCPQKRGWIDKD